MGKKKDKAQEILEQDPQPTNDQPDLEEQEESTEEQADQLNEMKDKYLRLFAEFDNYKKRTAKERLELIRTASEDVLKALLPVLDDFDRAKTTAETGAEGEAFSEGVSLVYNKLYQVLQNRGLQTMSTEEKEFDPELHEAITKIPAPNDELKGKIIDYIEKGYYLNDKIIRHAKVVIGE